MKPANKSPRRHYNGNANEISAQSSIIAQQQGTNRRGMGGGGGVERERERGGESQSHNVKARGGREETEIMSS